MVLLKIPFDLMSIRNALKKHLLSFFCYLQCLQKFIASAKIARWHGHTGALLTSSIDGFPKYFQKATKLKQ